MKNWRRGFWLEFFSRDNSVVNSMTVVSLVISAPVAALSFASLFYDIFWLGHGLKDTSVRLLLGLVTASTAGLGASLFSKRTYTEMVGTVVPGVEVSARPPGKRGPKLQGEERGTQ